MNEPSEYSLLASSLIKLYEASPADRDRTLQSITDRFGFDRIFFHQPDPTSPIFVPKPAVADEVARQYGRDDFVPCAIKLQALSDSDRSTYAAIAGTFDDHDRSPPALPPRPSGGGLIALYARDAVDLDRVFGANRRENEIVAVVDRCLVALAQFLDFDPELVAAIARSTCAEIEPFAFGKRLGLACQSLGLDWSSVPALELPSEADRRWPLFADPKPANYVVRCQDLIERGLSGATAYLVDFDWMPVRAPIELQCAVAVFNRTTLTPTDGAPLGPRWFAELSERARRFLIARGRRDDQLPAVLLYHLTRNLASKWSAWKADQSGVGELDLLGSLAHATGWAIESLGVGGTEELAAAVARVQEVVAGPTMVGSSVPGFTHPIDGPVRW